MKKKTRKRKLSTILYVLFWLMIIGAFTGFAVNQASRYNYYYNELNKVTEDLDKAKAAYDALLAQKLYYESDAYIEQLARDQLGYVKPDEIVFINVP